MLVCRGVTVVDVDGPREADAVVEDGDGRRTGDVATHRTSDGPSRPVTVVRDQRVGT